MRNRHLELLCPKPKRIRNPAGTGGDRARPPSGIFRTLLESTVWVRGTAAEGEQVVEDSALDLLHWEKDDGTSVIRSLPRWKRCRPPLKMNRRSW